MTQTDFDDPSAQPEQCYDCIQDCVPDNWLLLESGELAPLCEICATRRRGAIVHKEAE